MHQEVKQFIKTVKQLHRPFFYGKRVLEVGSLNINGSVRKFFWFCNYTGIDLAKGKGVDIVCPAHEHDEYEYYDTVISTECLEHDCHAAKSLRRMYDNLKPGGLLLITCAGPNRPEHGTKRSEPECSPFTTEYYRNVSMGEFESVLPFYLFTLYHIEYQRNKQDLMFYGIKK